MMEHIMEHYIVLASFFFCKKCISLHLFKYCIALGLLYKLDTVDTMLLYNFNIK